MTSSADWPQRQPGGVWIVVILLSTCATLAVASLIRDSITFDETKHFASGLSHVRTGDFRMAPDTPPLAQMVLALPGLFVSHEWPAVDAPGWRQGDIWVFGRHLLNDVNDGARWITPSRCAAVCLLLTLCILVYLVTRSHFGDRAALLSLLLTCCCPSLLAHGRLVATDLPITLASFAAICAYARLVQRFSSGRLTCFALAFASACLTKFSWPTVVPAFVAISLVAIFRASPVPVRLPLRIGTIAAATRVQKTLLCLTIAVVSGIGVFVCVWACYGFHYLPYRGPDAHVASMLALSSSGREAAIGRDESWIMTMEDAQGRPFTGATAWLIRSAREWRLLPEAYLFGLAFTKKTVQGQPTFLCGEVYDTARWHYFPLAFVLKTPIAVQLLAIVAAYAFLSGDRPRGEAVPFSVGLLVFIVGYFATAMASGMNLGQRHLLPVYPALYVLIGNAASVWRRKGGRVLLLGLTSLFAIESLSAFPNYLGYFNWFAGGATGGHKYLLGSNVDWGQDLVRLGDYVRTHASRAPIKLAYSGSANPKQYGVAAEELPSHFGFGGAPATLNAGTYVVSLNQLYGLYTRQIRDQFWNDSRNRESYRTLTERFAASEESAGESEAERKERQYAKERFELARQWRLINRLRDRIPDERIGSSLFVYHLSNDELQQMLAPY